MREHQGIDLLHDSGGGLTAQHGAFALMGLEFVKGDFFFPALMVQAHQGAGRVQVGIEQGGQQPMRLRLAGTLRVIKRVFDQAHQQAVTITAPISGIGYNLAR
nr:hypothetical protein [Thiorhodococcus minor]